jgi:hypothetical protein
MIVTYFAIFFVFKKLKRQIIRSSTRIKKSVISIFIYSSLSFILYSLNILVSILNSTHRSLPKYLYFLQAFLVK